MNRLPLSIRIILSPVRIVVLCIAAIPAMLIEAAGGDSTWILDYIMDAGNRGSNENKIRRSP